MKKEKWVWMPHAGHFICGNSCQFRLNTYVGKFIVSTVGEYRSPIEKDKSKFEEIGLNRLYETMVFKAFRATDKYTCCPYRMDVGEELDMEPYNTAEEAYKGHIKLCRKWSKKGETK